MSAWIFKNRVVWLVAWLVCATALDQGSKMWAQANLSVERTVTHPEVNAAGETVEVSEVRHVAKNPMAVIPGLFNFKYAENPAAAFSLTSNLPDWLRRPFLVGVSLLACLLLVVWYLKLGQADGLLLTSFAAIVSGALGNLIDRVRLSYVIDFLDVYVAPSDLARWLTLHLGTSHWPTFNVADMCIVLGALGVMWRTLRPIARPEE